MNVIMSALSVTESALKSSKFGMKGLIAGSAVAIGGIAAGEFVGSKHKDKNGDSTIKGAMVTGALAGTVASSMSTIEELYAFKNPNSVQALSSINSTTSASAKINSKSLIFRKEGRAKINELAKDLNKNGKNKVFSYAESFIKNAGLEMLAPENIFTSMVEMSMINDTAPGQEFINAMSKLEKPLTPEQKVRHEEQRRESAFGKEIDNRDKIYNEAVTKDPTGNHDHLKEHNTTSFRDEWLKDYDIKRKAELDALPKEKGFFGRVLDSGTDLGKSVVDQAKNSVSLADKGSETNPWFSNKAISIKGKENTIHMGDNTIKYINKDVELTGLETMGERMAKYADSHREFLDPLFKSISADNPKNKVKSVDNYMEYLRGIKPGAIGTHEELKRLGVYDKKSSLITKALGLMDETMDGSPVWARVASRQLSGDKNGKGISAELTKSLHIKREGGKIDIIKGLKTEESLIAEVAKLSKGDEVHRVTNEITDLAGHEHNKIIRGAALVADTVLLGGTISAIGFGAEEVLATPLKALKHYIRKDTNNVKSNSPINPMGRYKR